MTKSLDKTFASTCKDAADAACELVQSQVRAATVGIPVHPSLVETLTNTVAALVVLNTNATRELHKSLEEVLANLDA